MCRVCAMLHDEVAVSASARGEDHSHYRDINNWWRAPGTCINGSWRKFRRAVQKEREKQQQQQQQQQPEQKGDGKGEEQKEEKEKP